MTVSVTLGAGARLEIHEVSDFFRLMEADLSVSIEFYRGHRKVIEARNVRSGYAERFVESLSKIVIVNGAVAQDIQYVVRLQSEVEYDVPPVGLVEVTNKAGDHAVGGGAVTDAAGGTVLAAANAARDYLLVQNTDDAATMWVTTDGSVPTIGHGIKLLANGAYEPNHVPRGAVRAISDTAGALATVVEG